MIPLGQWTPDAPDYGAHATVANNCIAHLDHYSPFYAPVVYSDASTEAILTAFGCRSSAGTSYNFAGGKDKLQKISSAAWEDLSKVGGYETTAETRWSFTTFGNRVIATNYADNPQSYVMGTSTDFADLAGSPPKAKCAATVRGFVMLGNTPTSPTQLHWSALENPEDWTVAPSTTQCDAQTLYGETEIGEIKRIVGGEHATIFCELGIFVGTYVGGSLIFTFDQIIKGMGTLSGGSVASYGDMIFFLGQDGFYQLHQGQLIPIGHGKVDRFFFKEVHESEMWRISSTIDYKNSLYIVAYPTQGGSLGKLLIYNWKSQKWSTASPGNVECLFTFFSEPMTADSAAALALIGNPDTGSYSSVSADSSLFVLGRPSLSAVNTNHKVVAYDGAALTAQIETGEVQLNPYHKTTVTNVIPMVEGGAASVEIGYRNTLQEGVTYSDASTVNSDGECNIFNTARYQRARLSISGGFDKAYGVDFTAVKAGKY